MTKRILVIDDEKAVLRGIARTFANTPYTLETAASGSEGIKKALAQNYDLIFLDLHLQGVNGVEVFRELRRHNEETHIFFITGHYERFMDDLKKIKAEDLNFHLLQKPFSPEKLLQETLQILEGTQTNDITGQEEWRFILFVSGENSKTQKVYEAVKKRLETRFNSTHWLEMVDVLRDSELAQEHKVFMTPTLLKVDPIPSRSVFGDLENKQKIDQWLDAIGC